MSSETKLETIERNVKMLESRGLLTLPSHSRTLVPASFLDVKETRKHFPADDACSVIASAGPCGVIVSASAGPWGDAFRKQVCRTACGLVSVLGHVTCYPKDKVEGLGEARWKSDGESYRSKCENDMIDFITTKAPDFKKSGLTIDMMKEDILGSNFEIWRNTAVQKCFTEEKFVEKMVEEIENYGSMILNYNMTTLGQPPLRGHFSLAVAVAKKKRILVSGEEEKHYLLLLDTWPETPIAWVPVADMYKALNTEDKTNDSKFRGFLVHRRES